MRQIRADQGRLWAEVVGEIESESKVLVVKRIKVTYHLRANEDKREVIERVLATHANSCPVARTISGCVAISTDLVLDNE